MSHFKLEGLILPPGGRRASLVGRAIISTYYRLQATAQWDRMLAWRRGCARLATPLVFGLITILGTSHGAIAAPSKTAHEQFGGVVQFLAPGLHATPRTRTRASTRRTAATIAHLPVGRPVRYAGHVPPFYRVPVPRYPVIPARPYGYPGYAAYVPYPPPRFGYAVPIVQYAPYAPYPYGYYYDVPYRYPGY
jgi:hypothetical protein